MLVSVVIEISILNNFTRYFIGIFGGGVLGGGDKFKQSKHVREALACYQTSRGSNLINIIVFQMYRH